MGLVCLPGRTEIGTRRGPAAVRPTVAGNVGDSRVYWLPDAADEPARQLGRDDSFAQEQMAAGVPRQEAETGPHAHSITRWLGRDAPDDLMIIAASITSRTSWPD